MEMNEESILAWNIIEKTNANLFLTGKAGTGKTTFLKRLKELSPKRMIVLAPTGIAAINAGGMTIHSFFQLPFSPYVPGTTFGSGEQKRYQFSKLKRNIIRSIDLLVIDEISMVRSDLLDAVDSVLRQYRKRHDLPFGGVQLLMIGDLQQLAPVVTPQEEHLLGQHYDTPFFFSSNALKQVGYLTIELKKVYRQQDEQFISLLNQIRENKASEATLQALNQRYIPNFVPPKEGNYIRLTTHNAPAQYINEQQLAAPSQEQISSLELQYIIYCISELFDFYSIRASYEHLMRCLVEFFNGKYPRVVSEYQKLQVVLKSLIAVSDKFRVQYTGMLARNPDVRQAELQDRIHKGAMYFLDKIGILSDLIRKSNLDTDNKVARKQFEDRFSVFSEDVKLKERLLKYECSAEFTVTDYLKKKAQFLLLDADASSDSGSGRKSRRQKKPNEPKEPKVPKVASKEVSYDFYMQGMTVDQIAAKRGYTKGTIIGHLTPYVKEGKIGLRALISSAHEKKIRDFMKAHPELELFSEIKEALGAGIEYYEIKLVHDLMEGE